MARYLGAHPAVRVADRKELHFFDQNFDKGVDWYRAQFPDVADGVLVGEGTPAYLGDTLALERISEVLPDARLLVSVREPVARIWSHYWLWHERRLDVRSFPDALDHELEAYERDGPDAAEIPYLRNSMYAHQLSYLRQRFEPERIHVVVFERMVASPEEQYASVCEFLGVDPTERPANLGEPINPYVRIRSLKLREWTKKARKSPLRRVVARLNTKTDASYPEMPSEHHARLTGFFAPHNADLRELLDDPIPEWPTSHDREREA